MKRDRAKQLSELTTRIIDATTGVRELHKQELADAAAAQPPPAAPQAAKGGGGSSSGAHAPAKTTSSTKEGEEDTVGILGSGVEQLDAAVKTLQTIKAEV